MHIFANRRHVQNNISSLTYYRTKEIRKIVQYIQKITFLEIYKYISLSLVLFFSV